MNRGPILLTGTSGQLGGSLTRLLRASGDLVALDRSTLDLASSDAIRAIVREVRPRLIINAAAYTAVDRAEEEHANAHAVNAVAPGILAEEAKRLHAVLIHYSTDYVFDGMAARPYTEDDRALPQNVYGATKLEGENAVAASGAAALVLRTSWVYGREGRNFLVTIARLARERDELRIVADQIGVPNWTGALARATAWLIELGTAHLIERRGLYHLTCRGSASWFEFAQAIVQGDPALRARVVPITTAEYPLPARRPAYAVLNGEKFERTFGVTMPPWHEALQECLESEG